MFPNKEKRKSQGAKVPSSARVSLLKSGERGVGAWGWDLGGSERCKKKRSLQLIF